MALTTPEWLARHRGELRGEADGKSSLVWLDQKPLYLLVPVPKGNQHGCMVTQTNNGRRLDGPGTYTTIEDAIRGGLEDLRKALGW